MSDQKNPVVNVLANLAPSLGTMLGGPPGALVGALISHYFCGSIENPQDLANKIQADPDAAIKLKAIEAEAYKAQLIDVQNARDREIKTSDKTTSRLALIFTICYFIICFYLMFIVYYGQMNAIEQEPIKDVTKDLSMAEMLVLAYYFGASKPRG